MRTLNSVEPILVRFAWRSTWFIFGAICVIATSAKAEPGYPSEIRKHLDMSVTPACTLCHATPAGGGQVVTRFAQSMVAEGLTTDFSTLDKALDGLEKKGTDSNRDGIPDIVQLRQDTDPNTGESLAGAMNYGCGARVATGSIRGKSWVGLVAVLSMMACVTRLRRRRWLRVDGER